MTETEDTWLSSFKPLPPAQPMTPRELFVPLYKHDPATGTCERVGAPATADLIKHAERFGSECVAETAAEFMGVEGLTALIGRLDVIDRRRGEKSEHRVFKSKRPKLKPADVRARALLGIPEEETE